MQHYPVSVMYPTGFCPTSLWVLMRVEFTRLPALGQATLFQFHQAFGQAARTDTEGTYLLPRLMDSTTPTRWRCGGRNTNSKRRLTCFTPKRRTPPSGALWPEVSPHQILYVKILPGDFFQMDSLASITG